jgi:hypothetical protein
MRRRFGRKVTTALAAMAGAAVFAAAGLAYWSTTGGGTASARLAHAEQLTVSPASTPPDAALVPGGTAAVVAVVHNPNDFAVHVASFALASSGVDVDAPGCPADSVAFAGPIDDGGSDFVFAPGDTRLSLPDALRLSADAPDACQGATFTVHLEAGA